MSTYVYINVIFFGLVGRNEGNLFWGTTCKSMFQVKCLNNSQLSFEKDSDSLPLEFEKTDPNSYICRTWVSTQKIPPWWRVCGFPPGGLCIWSHTLKHRKNGNRFQRTSGSLNRKLQGSKQPRAHIAGCTIEVPSKWWFSNSPKKTAGERSRDVYRCQDCKLQICSKKPTVNENINL